MFGVVLGFLLWVFGFFGGTNGGATADDWAELSGRLEQVFRNDDLTAAKALTKEFTEKLIHADRTGTEPSERLKRLRTELARWKTRIRHREYEQCVHRWVAVAQARRTMQGLQSALRVTDSMIRLYADASDSPQALVRRLQDLRSRLAERMATESRFEHQLRAWEAIAKDTNDREKLERTLRRVAPMASLYLNEFSASDERTQRLVAIRDRLRARIASIGGKPHARSTGPSTTPAFTPSGRGSLHKGAELPLSVWNLIRRMKYREAVDEWHRLESVSPDRVSGTKPLLPRHFPEAGLWFFFVPGGRYTVGTPLGEPGRGGQEIEPREVRLESFYISATEVTQASYRRVIPDHQFGEPAGAEIPAHSVTYLEAVGFCRELSKRDRQFDYCLPSELEWEVACRAMCDPVEGPVIVRDVRDARRFKRRKRDELSQALQKYAHFRRNTSGGSPAPVGRKRPNRLGLVDMHGNVSEWCRRADAIEYDKALGNLGKRPQRGGSIQSSFARCRAGARTLAQKTEKKVGIGFRIIVRPEGKCKCE
jgi:formylglycine-generating enzyme required for sulfatase activity